MSSNPLEKDIEAVLGTGSPSSASGSRFFSSFDQLSKEFSDKFGSPFEITGTDTKEHLKFHGGEARDIRSRTLNDEQRKFLVNRARELDMDVRDFSFLRGATTTKTGVRLTGPHIHIQRRKSTARPSPTPAIGDGLDSDVRSVLSTTPPNPARVDRSLDSDVQSILGNIPKSTPSPNQARVDEASTTHLSGAEHPLFTAAVEEVKRASGGVYDDAKAREFLASKPGKKKYPNLPMPAGYTPGMFENPNPVERELRPEDTSSITAAEQLRAPSGSSLEMASMPAAPSVPAITATAKPVASTDKMITVNGLDRKRSTPEDIKQRVLEQMGFSPEDARSTPFEIRTPNPTEHINAHTGELNFFIPKGEYEVLARQAEESKRKQAAAGIPAAQAILDSADIPPGNKAIIQGFLNRLQQPVQEPSAPAPPVQIRPEDAGANALIRAMHDPNPQGKQSNPLLDLLHQGAGELGAGTLDTVSRPFVGASTAVAGLQRALGAQLAAWGGDPEAKKVLDEYGGANVYKAAWHALTTGEVPAGYEQPVAIVVRELAQRQGVDPEGAGGKLLYDTTSGLFDPVNLGALDLAVGKGASTIKNLRKPLSAIRREVAEASLASGLKRATTSKIDPASPQTASSTGIELVTEGETSRPREQQPVEHQFITGADVEPPATRRKAEAAQHEFTTAEELKPNDNQNPVSENIRSETTPSAQTKQQAEDAPKQEKIEKAQAQDTRSSIATAIRPEEVTAPAPLSREEIASISSEKLQRAIVDSPNRETRKSLESLSRTNTMIEAARKRKAPIENIANLELHQADLLAKPDVRRALDLPEMAGAKQIEKDLHSQSAVPEPIAETGEMITDAKEPAFKLKDYTDEETASAVEEGIAKHNQWVDRQVETHGATVEKLKKGYRQAQPEFNRKIEEIGADTGLSKENQTVLLPDELKSTRRTVEKIVSEAEAKGNPVDFQKGAKDLARASFVVSDEQEFQKVLTAIEKRFKVVGVKNRFKNPTPVHYADYMMNVDLGDGRTGEIQIHVKEMLDAKEGRGAGHKFYEVQRTLDAIQGTRELSPAEKSLYARMKTEQQALYARARNEFTKRSNSDFEIWEPSYDKREAPVSRGGSVAKETTAMPPPEVGTNEMGVPSRSKYSNSPEGSTDIGTRSPSRLTASNELGISNEGEVAIKPPDKSIPSASQEKILPEKGEQSTAAREPAAGQFAVVEDYPVANLKVDPEKFQYKVLHNESGATGSLAGVKKFDKRLAGTVQVWRDPATGQVYVVNGHNRFDLARKTGAEGLNVMFLDAKDAAEARALGALSNIAEGRGNPIDAAKFLRDTKHTPAELERLGINLKEKIASDGLALSKLNDFLFSLVAKEQMPIERGVLIGSKIENPDLQNDLFKLISKQEQKGKRITNAVVSELADMVAAAPSKVEVQATLFGNQEGVRSFAVEKAEVSAYMRKELAHDQRLFATVSKNAEDLKKAGNVIDVEASSGVSKDARELLGIFDSIKNRKGGVSDILDEAARRMGNGENAAKVKQETYKRIREEIPKTLRGADKPAGPASESLLGAHSEGEGISGSPDAPAGNVTEAAKRTEILDRLKKRLETERGSGGPSTETVMDLAQLAASYVREGTSGYQKWIAELQNEIGLEFEKLKPHLLGAWKAAREAVESESKDTRRPAIQKELPQEPFKFITADDVPADPRRPAFQRGLPSEPVDLSGATPPGKMKAEPLLNLQEVKSGPNFFSKETAVDLVNLPRGIMASLDLSAPLRQGAILTLTEPKTGIAASRDMLKSLSESGFEKVKTSIESHPRAKLAEDVKLHLSTRDGAKGLAEHEEAFMSRWVGKIPGLKHSEQAYVAYLDRLRIDTFSKYADELEKAGLTYAKNKKEFEDIANFINYATGRGDLGKMGNAIAPVLNGAFFSPRYAMSRIQLMNPRTYWKMSPAARKIAARKMVEFTGVVTTTLSLAKLAGADVSLDPDSPDFLKIKVGNTRYDALAGFQQYIRAGLQMAKGFYNNSVGNKNERGKEPMDIALKFMRSKTSPLASFGWDAATGKNFKGEKFSVKKGLAERLAPMVANDFYEAWKEEGGKGVAKTIPGFFGAGVQNYKEKGDSLSALDTIPELKRLGIETPRLEQKADESDAAFKKRQGQSDKQLEKNKGESDDDFQKRQAATEEAIKKSVETLVNSKLYERLSDAQRRKAIYERIEKVKREQSSKFFPKAKSGSGLSISDILN